jgi:hypothetical protein
MVCSKFTLQEFFKDRIQCYVLYRQNVTARKESRRSKGKKPHILIKPLHHISRAGKLTFAIAFDESFYVELNFKHYLPQGKYFYRI